MTQIELNKIAIIGRPNVGKSALFNRIMGKRIAIVDQKPGITRDRLGMEAVWLDRKFTLLDTGGIGIGEEEPLADQVHLQAQVAITEASVILFAVDITDGVTPLDEMIADLVREAADKVFVAVNKCDNIERQQEANVFYKLGFKQVFPISAMHGLGVGDLMDAAIEKLPRQEEPEVAQEEPVKIAAVGKPNAGKSTFINSLLGEQRLVVDSVPGTTRDAVDVFYRTKADEPVIMIDTAGIKRKRNIKEAVEKYSLMRSEESIKRCDIALFFIDAEANISATDARIANMITSAGKTCLIVVNKWDLMEKMNRGDYRKMVYERLKFLSYAPVLFISAATDRDLDAVIQSAASIVRAGSKKIPTPVINQIVQDAQVHYQPPLVRGKRLKIYYMTQLYTMPAKFLVFVNDPELLKKPYLNYLEHRIRERFPLDGVPIFFQLRRRAQ